MKPILSHPSARQTRSLESSTRTPQIHIGRLRLRIPGDSRETGSVVAQVLAERLADLQTGAEYAHYGVLHLRIPGQPEQGPEGMAARISSALERYLAEPRSTPHA